MVYTLKDGATLLEETKENYACSFSYTAILVAKQTLFLGFQVATMIPCIWHSHTKINTVKHVTVRRSFNGRCRFHILTQCVSKELLNYLALQLNKVISTIQNNCFSYHSSSSNYLDFFFRSHTNIYLNIVSIVDGFHAILVRGRSLFVAGEGWGLVGFRFCHGNIYLISPPPPDKAL